MDSGGKFGYLLFDSERRRSGRRARLGGLDRNGDWRLLLLLLLLLLLPGLPLERRKERG
jgi:hypothetical protein